MNTVENNNIDALIKSASKKKSRTPQTLLSDESILHLWEGFVDHLENEFGHETIDRWVKPLKSLGSEKGKLYFEAADSFQALWFEEHIRPHVKDFVDPNTTFPIPVLIKVRGQNKKKKKPEDPHSFASKEPFGLNFEELDPTCTFEHFITTQENEVVNRLLDEMCGMITQKKMRSISPLAGNSFNTCDIPNPIYLYGPSGSGKTHLLMAIAHRLRRCSVNVIWARSELFTEHVIRSIRASEMSHFRALWRTTDVLLIDDIQHLARKAATQEEFFHTFNTLHLSGKQIVITSNCLPQQLQYIEPRLVSRFEWGIALPCIPLAKKQLSHLIEQKSHLIQFPITPRIIDFLIETFGSNPKSCLKALHALALRLQVGTGPKSQKVIPPVSMIRDILADLIEEEQRNAMTGEKVIAAVSEIYGITPSDIIGKAQVREYVLPRQIAIYLTRKHTKLPYMKIGEIFRRDHSTIMSSIKQIEKQISERQSDVGSMIASIEIRLTEIR